MTADGAPASRAGSLQGRLARLGFVDPPRAVRLLSDPGLVGLDDDAVEDLALAPDPDLALTTLSRVAETRALGADAFIAALDSDGPLRARAYAVLGTSAALGDHLVRHPQDWVVLRAADPDSAGDATAAFAPLGEVRADLLRAVGADPSSSAQQPSTPAPRPMPCCARPTAAGCSRSPLPTSPTAQQFVDVSAALSDLADATLEAALAIARAEHPDDVARLPPRRPRARQVRRSRAQLHLRRRRALRRRAARRRRRDRGAAVGDPRWRRRSCGPASAATTEGTIWEVDPNLRPEGKNGALVRTLASYEGYYERWASTWEFQALLKARPAAGDADARRTRSSSCVTPLVWTAADRAELRRGRAGACGVASRRTCRPRTPTASSSSAGAGCATSSSRCSCCSSCTAAATSCCTAAPRSTALEALATYGYVGRDDASALDDVVRVPAHARAPHPGAPAAPHARDPRRRGRPAPHRPLDGPAHRPGGRAAPRRCERHAREVRRLHEKLFYRPLLHAVARLDAGEARLTPEAARQRLEALGYSDPAGALRHLEALTSGVTRRAAIQRTLLPVMLGWFADAADPDAGLLAFRRMSDALGSTPWYLRLLRDESLAAQRLARVLASSRYASDLLMRAPEAVAMLADDDELEPRGRARRSWPRPSPRRAATTTPRSRSAAVRALRRRELFRTCRGRPARARPRSTTAGVALSGIAAATIVGALELAARAVESERGSRAADPLRSSSRWAASAAASSATAATPTCMFVHDPVDRCASERDAHGPPSRSPGELRRLLDAPDPGPAARGRRGRCVPRGVTVRWCVRSRSYAAYYARWSLGLGGAGAAACGTGRRRRRAGRAASSSSSTRCATPRAGSPRTHVREIRRLKARMEAERLPRGADPGAAHEARSRGAVRRRVGGPAAASCSTGTTCRRCARPAPSPALAAAVDAGAPRRRGRGRPRRGVAHRDPGARRRHAGARAGPETWCRPTRATWPPCPRCSATVRARVGVARRLPSGDATGPRAWWRGCSTRERAGAGRRAHARSTRAHRSATSLAVREFRGIVLAQVASEAGDQIARVALALLVLSHTGSPLLAAATFAVSFVPSFVGGALLGPLADRFSRRVAHAGRRPRPRGADRRARARAPSTARRCGSCSCCCSSPSSSRRCSTPLAPRQPRRCSATSRWSRPARRSPAC